ncbi:MAG: DUF305 domain-containing protein [Anaerolineae bacterium]
MRKWIALPFVLAAMVAVVVAACPVQADGSISGRAGRAELRFLQGMIDHHQMALDMAEDCLAKTKTEALVKLCQGVIQAQSREIAQMQEWLKDWYQVEYKPMPMKVMMEKLGSDHGGFGGTYANQHGDHSGHGGMATAGDPPMMMGMFAGFSRLKGVEYEAAWLEAMIDHHDDALHMSQRILNYAEHSALKALAEAIIKSQSEEIKLMEQMINAMK